MSSPDPTAGQDEGARGAEPTGALRCGAIHHVVPLKRGGADSPSNMQWQTTSDAKAKDKWE